MCPSAHLVRYDIFYKLVITTDTSLKHFMEWYFLFEIAPGDFNGRVHI